MDLFEHVKCRPSRRDRNRDSGLSRYDPITFLINFSKVLARTAKTLISGVLVASLGSAIITDIL